MGLLHFRGAYHNPAMFLPVTVPPVAAALLGGSALGQAREPPRRLTRWWLRLTALLGVAGVGFHAMGVARNMGGWRNWSQNLLNGPPIPCAAELHRPGAGWVGRTWTAGGPPR